MNLFTVDQNRCKKDGICAAVCPIGIIETPTEDAYPTFVKDAQRLCINCGHCLSVCPNGALLLEKMKPDECLVVQKQMLPNSVQIEHFLSARRSIRNYLEKPVDKDTLSKLISIARYAPSGHNVQQVNWLVIEDSAKVRLMAGHVIDWMRMIVEKKPEVAELIHAEYNITAWEKGEDKICRGAPHIMIAHTLGNQPIAKFDCIIALTYLELAAFSMGLGACWAGYFHIAALTYPPLQQALNLPEGHQSSGVMMVGYPKYEYNFIPKRNSPIVTWL